MPSRPSPKPLPAFFVCHEHPDAPADALTLTGDVHPGWVAASRILLRGLARLEAQERKSRQEGEAGEGQETPQKTSRPTAQDTRRA